MKSDLFKQFGIPVVECEIEPRLDDQRIPRLLFRSTGNPLVGLDIGGATLLSQSLSRAGECDKAKEIDRYIEQAKRLATSPSL